MTDTRQRDAPLALKPDAFRRTGHALVESIATFLETMADRPVTRAESQAQVRAALDADARLPEHGSDLETLVTSTADLLFDHSLFNGHPRFYGYITSSPAPVAMLGDFLAAAVNANVGAWQLSPMASEIEAQAVRWIAELVGYPRDCGGLLLSGGNLANFTALPAALAAHDGAARARGRAASALPLRIYASSETHTWLHKATDITGLGTDAIRWIPTDDDLRIDTAALRAAIASDTAAGEHPLMVVGTAGSVSTGAIDPLAELAEISREAGAWFHVDGAYGGFAAALPDAPADLRVLEHADSLALDPHKWLYAPLEAGCLLVRDADALRNAYSYHPPYYHFGEQMNYYDYGPQNSRGFRALKVWLALRQAGRAGYIRMIGDDVRLAERLFQAIRNQPELDPITLSLSITTFRFVPADLRDKVDSADTEAYLNTLNEALLERIQSSGAAYVSNAVIRSRYALRTCIVNFNTNAADVDALPPLVARLGREVDGELR